MPPGNSFISVVLPLSRERASATFARSTGDSAIIGARRCFEIRFAVSLVGITSIAGPGARSITKPIQLYKASEPPSCVPLMKTPSVIGWLGVSASMISCRYGVRLVRQGPGSALEVVVSFRCASAQADTVMSRSGAIAAAYAAIVAR